MTTSRIKITTHGAVFTGQASRDIRNLLDDLKKDAAEDGLNLVKQRLGERMKAPTGTYTGQLRVQKLSKFNDQLITDGGVVYGPWLESGQYSPPRRFKGYKAFRRARTQLRKKWIPVAQQRFDQLVAKWNSGGGAS